MKSPSKKKADKGKTKLTTQPPLAEKDEVKAAEEKQRIKSGIKNK